MCKCTPNIRTPFCGKGDCVWPDKKKPEGARESEATEMISKENLGDIAKNKAKKTLDIADQYIQENNLTALRELLVKALADTEAAIRGMELLCGGREVPTQSDQVGAIKEVALAAIDLAKTQCARQPK